MKGDSLGDRMKDYYEKRSQQSLSRRIPVMMRLDGKAFHTFTRGCQKPFDDKIINAMQRTTQFLMHKIQGAKVGYVQSDEISILITDYDSLETDAWFDYKIQKMCSVSAGQASVKFTLCYAANTMGECPSLNDIEEACFDSRVFNIPKEDVVNCFRWRYQDWVRNSIQMVAQANYSQKELNGVSCKELVTKLETEKGIRWDEYKPVYKNGTLFYWNTGINGEKVLVQDSTVNLNSNEECEIIFNKYV